MHRNIVPFIILTLTTSVFADAKSDYEMLFGDEAKKVSATKSTADDAAFAKKLLDAAKAMADVRKTRHFLYEKVVQFGSKDVAGAPHALSALRILMRAQPDQKAKWQEAKLNVTEKQFQKYRGAAQKSAARAYLDVLIQVAEAKAATGKAAEAGRLYRKGIPAAIFAGYKLSELRGRIRGLAGAVEAQAEHEKLIKKLADDPKDTKTREKLILIYVMERDDPAKAASLLATGVDRKLRENVPLAAKKPKDLMETACMQLGDWYKQLAAKGSAKGKAAVLARARMYYERYLSLHRKRDVGRYKASAALVEVNKELKRLGGVVVPSPKSPSGAPSPKSPTRKMLALDLGKDVTMDLVHIPAGTFIMGSPKTEKDRRTDEGPQRKVTISKPFFMGVTEVTQEQYEAVMGKNPSKYKDPENPVETVSWDAAVEFCKKLSAKTRHSIRLPTEAEWEYACRAGTKTRFYFGKDDKRLGDYAWHKGNSGKKVHPVAQKKPNAWGLYDMPGSVWEWCADWYEWKYYAKAKAVDPQGATSGIGRVTRGGDWGDSGGFVRSAVRFWAPPGVVSRTIGFRVVVAMRD